MTARRFHTWLVVFALAGAVGAPPARAATDGAPGPPSADGIELFEKRVRPIFHAHCTECHGERKQKGGLRLDRKEPAMRGGEGGTVLVPGDPGKSRLVQAVRWTDPDLQMPSKKKLADADVEAVAAWVQMGAPWPDESPATAKATFGSEFDLARRKAAHWAWQPVRRHPAPPVNDSDWPRDELDRFIIAKLEDKGLHPAPEADRRALVRRVYFDLVGLPPPAEVVDALAADDSPGAYERLVDRLLASEQFGVKWARHWLDLVRYAETRGHEFDPLIPNAWQYRDYVVRALNADVPYDRFVIEHIAGDLLERPRLNPERKFNESVLGTGFWFLGEEVHSPVDIRQDEADRLDNRLDTMTKAFLGLTVACARCHDHKFDAISQADYYGMTGFLLSATYRQARFETTESEKEAARRAEAVRAAARGPVGAALGRALRPGAGRMAEHVLAARGWRAPGAEALDAASLTGWAAALREAERDSADPLHLLARMLPPRKGGAADGFAARLAGVVEELRARRPAAGSARVIVDYAAVAEGGAGWYADGYAFGLGPARAGDLVWGSDADRPVIGVVARAAARRDPLFHGIRSAPGTEKDHGRLGDWDRAGRTLRTPKVTLGGGKLWYLLRGAGRAYAAVDSHLVIAGPLHGRLLAEWKADGREAGRWKWVGHDLSAYAGQRAHVAFVPATADGALEVAKVVEADAAPAAAEGTSQALLAAIAAAGPESPEALARAYQRAFEDAIRAIEPGEGSAQGRAAPETQAARAELADWLVRHLDLLAPPGSEGRQALADAAGPALRELADLRKGIKAESATAPAMFEGNGVEENVLKRGSPRTPGEVVPRRFLEAIAGPAAGQPSYGPGSGRMQLARAMLADDNPFVARVIVNRVWHHLFGTGIVPTVDNFGVLGQRPSHPELLDTLADEFRREGGWSLKRLIRRIVLSSTYRTSSRADPAAEVTDPLNALRHHMPVRRLTAEAIRDSLLAVSGRLDARVGGPPVEVHLTPFMDGRGRPGAGGPLDGDGRRSLYTRVRRNFLPPMMLAFDMPIPFQAVGRRNVSNVPAQALILMNDPFIVAQAKAWARRALADKGWTPGRRVERMYVDAFARPPTDRERAEALAFLREAGELHNLPPGRATEDERPWADLAHVLFNVKEFVFAR